MRASRARLPFPPPAGPAVDAAAPPAGFVLVAGGRAPPPRGGQRRRRAGGVGRAAATPPPPRLNGWRVPEPVPVRAGDQVTFGALTLVVAEPAQRATVVLTP